MDESRTLSRVAIIRRVAEWLSTAALSEWIVAVSWHAGDFSRLLWLYTAKALLIKVFCLYRA